MTTDPTPELTDGTDVMPIPVPVPLTIGSEKCVSCGSPVVDKFCSRCGQRTNVKRITWREGWNDFWSRVYGFDGMFPRTLRDLTIRPGKAALEFIGGNRVKYYGPVGYFFLMITLFLLVMSMLNITFYEFMMSQQIVDASEQTEGQAKMMRMVSDWMSENMRTFSFMIIPFIALGGKLFFRKSGLNFLEHSVLPLYINGHIYWLTIISLVVFKFTGIGQTNMIGTLFSLSLFGLGYMQLMSYQSKVKAFVKGILTYLFGFLLFLIFFIVVTVIYVLNNKDVLQMFKPTGTP